MKELNRNGTKSQSETTNKSTSSSIQKKGGPTYGSLAKDSLVQRSINDQANDKSLQRKGASESSSKMPSSVQAKMENSFGTDFSNVTIHQGESATQMNALAYTQGNDIHFAPGQYNPESQSGQELLGHELTHVVQQRSGRVQPTTQLKEVGLNDDSGLEKEANEMGKLASEGKAANIHSSSGSVNSGNSSSIQRFGSFEHKTLGDAGSSNATVELSQYFKVSFGDMTALAGDWFGSANEVHNIAALQGSATVGKTPEEVATFMSTVPIFNKPGTVDDIKYAVVVGIRGRSDVKHLFSTEVKNSVDKRATGLITNNWDHFSNSSSGDKNKQHKDKVNSFDPHKHPLNNATSYRMNHDMAINEAISAGLNGGDLKSAMLYESFASHFLTDAYAAGHTRTERYSATQYWKEKYPMFWTNIQWWIAEKLTYYIKKHNSVMWGIPTGQLIFEKALGIVQSKLKDMPSMSFGDMISGAMHDFDNKNGVMAKTDAGSKAIKLFGDGQLLDKNHKVQAHSVDTYNVCTNAVKVSIMDIQDAYSQAKSGQSAEYIKNGLLTQDKIYRSEQLWPKALPDNDPLQKDNPSQLWKASSFEELIKDTRIKEALKLFLAEKISDIKSTITLDEQYQKDAFEHEVLKSLQGDDGIKSLGQIIHYYPGVVAPLGGIGGHDEDDNAYKYYKEAKKNKAVNSLTITQRVGLIKPVLDGTFVVDEDDILIADLINTTPAYAMKYVIDTCGGWRSVYKAVDGDEVRSIVRKAGPSYWAQASNSQKEAEISFLADGYTSDLAQETIVVILRTMPKAKVKEIGEKYDLTFDLDGAWEDKYNEMIK